jgi:hypothetical protein
MPRRVGAVVRRPGLDEAHEGNVELVRFHTALLDDVHRDDAAAVAGPVAGLAEELGQTVSRAGSGTGPEVHPGSATRFFPLGDPGLLRLQEHPSFGIEIGRCRS